MSTLNEHQANENAPEVSPQSTTTLAQLREALQHFDILSSKAEKYIYKYAYLYLIGFFLVDQLLLIITFLTIVPGFKSINISPLIKDLFNEFKYYSSLELLFVIGICLIFWTFNIWRKSVPKTLRDIYEKNLIYSPAADLNSEYFEFLNLYLDALRNPRRYLLGALLLSVGTISLIFWNFIPVIGTYISIMQIFSFQHLILLILGLVSEVFGVLVVIGIMYCFGIMFWSLYISGQHLRKLSQTFEFRIEPVHPDKCGGLKELGNFCFGLVSPLFIGTIFSIGFLLVAAYVYAPYVLVIFLFIIYLFVFPVAIFAFFRPLWSIHMKMLSARMKAEDHHFGEIVSLREKIQSLLDANELIEAKNMKDKKEMKEALYIPSPVWPFSFRSKIFTTFLGAGGSLLLGVLTALVSPFAQTILHLPK